MKVRLAVVVFYKGAYRPPGYEIDLPDDEALALIDRWGEAEPNIILRDDEQAGIDNLNRFAQIHGGYGE